jgi:hypothetical protein
MKGEQRYLILICTRGLLEPTSTRNNLSQLQQLIERGVVLGFSSKCNDGTWFLRKVILEHNHQLSPDKARFFRCNKIINDAAKRRLELNYRARILLSKNFNSLVVENWGFESLSLKREIVEILLTRQESFGLVKGVPRHFVIISVERKRRTMASIV